MNYGQKMKRGCSVTKLIIMVGLLLLISILITVQIKFSSSSTDLSQRWSLTNYSVTSTNQPPPPESELVPVKFKRNPLTSTEISCDRTSNRYDLCKIRGHTVVDPTTSTFFVMGPKGSIRPKIVEKIKPYPRKFEDFIMAQIKNVTLISGPQSPPCKIHHDVPALVFSVGGYTGNFFHDFTDGFIPFFITVNTIFPDHQDFMIVLSEDLDWWPTKYADLLNMFTKHPIISLENESQTHCFPFAHVGLISHGFMAINHTLLPNLKTYLQFRKTLHEAYGSHHKNQGMSRKNLISRPRLLFASRKGVTGRVILNQRKVIRVMKDVGFDVVVFEPTKNTSLHESYVLVNSCHAMLGVHGAALTHSLFLRPGSVLMQIVPIGTEWAAKAFFGNIAEGLKLEYMEYKIKVKESSLVMRKYGKDSMIMRNPSALQKNGWPIELMDIYLKEQNVKLDLARFRVFFEEAYKKAYEFMHQEKKGV